MRRTFCDSHFTVQEEEKKKELAEKEKKQQEDRQPSGTYKPSRFQNDSWGASAGGPGSGYGSRDGGYGGRDGGYGGRDSGRSYGATGGSGYGNREGGREYQPREKNPLPDRPPFTAYIGNLPFDKASEEDLDNFFGELGISDIRIAKDPATGRPKGFAYIEFNDRAGLENALAADGAVSIFLLLCTESFQDFGSRKLSVDVASTRDRGDDDRNRWGPRDGSGSASGFGQRREREFDRDREPRPDSRYDSSGPNNWRHVFSFSGLILLELNLEPLPHPHLLLLVLLNLDSNLELSLLKRLEPQLNVVEKIPSVVLAAMLISSRDKLRYVGNFFMS